MLPSRGMHKSSPVFVTAAVSRYTAFFNPKEKEFNDTIIQPLSAKISTISLHLLVISFFFFLSFFFSFFDISFSSLRRLPITFPPSTSLRTMSLKHVNMKNIHNDGQAFVPSTTAKGTEKCSHTAIIWRLGKSVPAYDVNILIHGDFHRLFPSPRPTSLSPIKDTNS